jgi:PAP2 superfamily
VSGPNEVNFGQGAPNALRRLTRRDLLVGTGKAAIGLAAVGALGAPARATTRFPGADQFDAEVPTAWFELAPELIRLTPGYSPPVASRALAYAGAALYEAVRPGMDGFRSLAELLPGLALPRGAGKNAAYHWPTVANAALAAVVRSLFPTAPVAEFAAVATLEERFSDTFRPTLPPGVFARSVAHGRDVATAIFEWSKEDGGHEGYLRNFPRYDAPVGPGYWVPTPPGFLPGLQPSWGSNRCMALPGADCPPGGHPPFSQLAGSDFYREALEVYDVARSLTSEQEEIARFWSDDPGRTATPSGHSASIATQVLRREEASLARAAEAYVRVGIAVCDAFIACWHQKYVYNLIRPVTYLQRVVDPDWLPILITPPFPEYPSGHSVQSGAALQVLTDLFGERYAFVDHTHDARGFAPRRFGSFLEAAEEASISRLYGGIHFRAAIVNGITQGRCIGERVSALPLR